MPGEVSHGATAQDSPAADVESGSHQKLKCIGRYILSGNTLGKGNFARVEEANHCLTETKVAIKIIDIDRIQEEYVRKNLLREAKLMRGLKHPNIIRLYETMKTSHLYCMVTELAEGGELLSHVRHDYKERRLPEAVARPFVRQLTSALQHLHSQGIVHRDLKMENILLDKKKRYVKIVDFGLSNAAQPGSLLATHCGSPEYAAPELFIPGRQYGPEVDIWSLGVNIFAMVIGKLPFRSPKQGARKRQRLLEMISNGLSEAHEKEMTHLTAACNDIIKMVLQPDICNRATLDDIMVHPWITKNGHYPLLPFKPLPPDLSVKQSSLDLICKSGNVSAEEVNDSVERDKCDWMSALYHILLDSSEARKVVQRKLKAETKKFGSKGNLKDQSLIDSSFYLRERGSSDFIAYESDGARLEDTDQDPTPMVEESYLDIMDIRAGQNTLRLHRSPIGTWERRRSASHPLDPDSSRDDSNRTTPQQSRQGSGGIHYSDAPATRPRIPRTMMHHYKDGEAVVPRVSAPRKYSAGNTPPAYTLVHYDSAQASEDIQMRRSTSLDMRSGYNPTYTWDRLRNKSTQPQPSYPAQQQVSNQTYHTSPRPNTNSDGYSRRHYEYMDEGIPPHSYNRTGSYGHNLNSPVAHSMDWAQYHQSQEYNANQTWGSNHTTSLKKGKRSTNTSYMEHLGDTNTPLQYSVPTRKHKERHSIMPVFADNTSTIPGYKTSFSEEPIDPKELSKTLPGRIKKPSKMPGSRGYSKTKDPKEKSDPPIRMLSNPDPNVVPFSANRGNNAYDHSFTSTGGYKWMSDQQLARSKVVSEKTEKKKIFWKFRNKNKSKENLSSPNTRPITPPAENQAADTRVFTTLSKKNLFSSSIHSLHKHADITSLMKDPDGNAQKIETDLVSKPTQTLPPMEESTPATKGKSVSRRTAHQQLHVTQVKPVAPGFPAETPPQDTTTDATDIKIHLQPSTEAGSREHLRADLHDRGYMSDSGLDTPRSSAREIERPTSSKKLRSLLVRPFKSGKKKS